MNTECGLLASNCFPVRLKRIGKKTSKRLLNKKPTQNQILICSEEFQEQKKLIAFVLHITCKLHVLSHPSAFSKPSNLLELPSKQTVYKQKQK